jgi:hypothetical protein
VYTEKRGAEGRKKTSKTWQKAVIRYLTANI